MTAAAALVVRVFADRQRIGFGLLVYSALLFGSSLLLATSWVPPALIVAGAAVSLVHARTGVALVRRSAWPRALIATSGALHLALVAAWISLLV